MGPLEQTCGGRYLASLSKAKCEDFLLDPVQFLLILTTHIHIEITDLD